MAFWAGAAPALIGAGGSLLSGLFGSKDRRKAQSQDFANQLRLIQEQTRLSQVGLDNPWRRVSWEGPQGNRRQVVTLQPQDQEALDRHRAFRATAMANWNPEGGWYDDDNRPAAATPEPGPDGQGGTVPAAKGKLAELFARERSGRRGGYRPELEAAWQQTAQTPTGHWTGDAFSGLAASIGMGRQTAAREREQKRLAELLAQRSGRPSGAGGLASLLAAMR